MSIIELLKEDYLYEDEDNPVIDLTAEMNSISGNDSISPVDKDFIIKLANHLDKKLTLEYGTLDDQIYNEIRNYMDQSDNKKVKQVKERIHKIILDEKRKFLKKIQTRMERLQIPKKKV
jgi:hypothetical protein